MNGFKRYVVDFFRALASLATGLRTTLREFFTRKSTECYPENRAALHLSPRFRGTLRLLYDEEGRHRCVACRLCEMACPNGTIHLEVHQEPGADGRPVRRLVRYDYDLGSCLFCQLCVNGCPHGAIAFDQEFEHAVFDRTKLHLILNREAQDPAKKL